MQGLPPPGAPPACSILWRSGGSRCFALIPPCSGVSVYRLGLVRAVVIIIIFLSIVFFVIFFLGLVVFHLLARFLSTSAEGGDAGVSEDDGSVAMAVGAANTRVKRSTKTVGRLSMFYFFLIIDASLHTV